MSCRIIVTLILAVITAVTAVEIISKVDNKAPYYQYMKTKPGEKGFHTIQTDNGVLGVSSIAGITSRNGRVSSVSGVKLYPGIQSPVVATSISTADLGKNTDSKLKYPVSARVIKSEDGKYASSSVQISPGSVSVTSIARSAPPTSGKSNSLKRFSSGSNSLKTPLQPQIKPFINGPFMQNPIDIRQGFNSWFPNYNMFAAPFPARANYQPGYVSPLWQYPSFPIINYWQ